MDELNNLLNMIVDCYNKRMDNDSKYNIVSELWTKYYKLSQELGIELDYAYQIHLMCESECYKIYQEPILKNVDMNIVKGAIKKINMGNGITYDEARSILDYIVNETRYYYEHLGVNIKKNSLNGYCELGQVLTIMPFEKLGLKVTKNTAKDSFNYRFHHVFGTVTFPINDNNTLKDVTYLIDTTYRQFFTSVNCNYGRYYTMDENNYVIANPDPGYFVDDIMFAKKILADGYIELTGDTAYKYGRGFYLSNFGANDIKRANDRDIDYYKNIISSRNNYTLYNYDSIDVVDFNNIMSSRCK